MYFLWEVPEDEVPGALVVLLLRPVVEVHRHHLKSSVTTIKFREMTGNSQKEILSSKMTGIDIIYKNDIINIGIN